eukprot:NODE_3940_length_860_cov_5.176326_g3270_i0.p3 GENE.NODE_3940_length_860_cov_5.176326_g3270_i0~~NODE_3940_length_860_cov_5.176326_g3270_i0.p3  ORF type:complete len:78 (+),score=0.77 NODE_3940_length_860_cov_5.176326_g3270_i0:593-826(+)
MTKNGPFLVAGRPSAGFWPPAKMGLFLAILAKKGAPCGLLAAKTAPAGDLRSKRAFGGAWLTRDHFLGENGRARCHF